MEDKDIYEISKGYVWEGTQDGILMGIWVLNKNIEKLTKAVKEIKNANT